MLLRKCVKRYYYEIFNIYITILTNERQIAKTLLSSLTMEINNE